MKALEEQGIGRPSTYAPILSTLRDRGYVMRADKRLEPTELGMHRQRPAGRALPRRRGRRLHRQYGGEAGRHRPGRAPWVPVMREFYGPFAVTLAHGRAGDGARPAADELADEVCEKCGRQMVIKLGRYGKFIACPGFPECRNAKPLLLKSACRARSARRHRRAAHEEAARSSTAAPATRSASGPPGRDRSPSPAPTAAGCWSRLAASVPSARMCEAIDSRCGAELGTGDTAARRAVMAPRAGSGTGTVMS